MAGTHPRDWVKPPVMQPAPLGSVVPGVSLDPMALLAENAARDRMAALEDTAARREMNRQMMATMQEQVQMMGLTRQLAALSAPQNGTSNGHQGGSELIEMLKVLGQKDETTQRSIAELQRQMMDAQQAQMKALQDQLANLAHPQVPQTIIEKANEIKTLRDAFMTSFPESQKMPDQIQTHQAALEWFKVETDKELRMAEFHRLEAKDEAQRRQADREVDAAKARYEWLAKTVGDVGPMITNMIGARFGSGGASGVPALGQETVVPREGQVPVVTIECSSCHRPMEVRSDQSRAECPRCGAVMYAPGTEPDGEENVVRLPRAPSRPGPVDSEGDVIDVYPVQGPPLTPPPAPAHIQPPSPVG